MVKSGKWKRNQSDDGWMPCCAYCSKVFADAEIGDVKNYPEDGHVSVFFECKDCDEESQFIYTPVKVGKEYYGEIIE